MNPNINLDRYFDRQDHITQARAVDCPECHARAGERCIDRWGHTSSFVHLSRHPDGYADPYPLT